MKHPNIQRKPNYFHCAQNNKDTSDVGIVVSISSYLRKCNLFLWKQIEKARNMVIVKLQDNVFPLNFDEI